MIGALGAWKIRRLLAGEPVVDPEPRKEKTHEINHRFYRNTTSKLTGTRLPQVSFSFSLSSSCPGMIDPLLMVFLLGFDGGSIIP